MLNRKNFLKTILGAGMASSLNLSSRTNVNHDILDEIAKYSRSTSGSMYGYQDEAIDKVRVGIIGLGNRGSTLLQMFRYNVEQGDCEIVALADKVENKVNKAAEELSSFQKNKARSYAGSEDAWKKMVHQDDIDLVLITTPWSWHTPMSIYAMEHGKHVACEVPIAYTLSDCWDLAETAERTKRHCIMIENCCYNDEELFVLNMIEKGIFGDLTHTEGAYIHDLRAHMLSETYYEDQWRIQHHASRDGNFYTTHGLGPISTYLHLGRGDELDYLTSMSSRELNLSQTANSKGSPYTDIKCGDMNTTMMKTKKGKTIMLQFDVHTASPYSRINKVVGTKAVHQGYPSKLYIDDGELLYWGHKWLDEDKYNEYRTEYRHPMIKKLKTISEGFKQGHGGMDFVMIYRLIKCLNLGLPLDFNVYDGISWSAVTPLSELSVASSSLPVPIPDFAKGKGSVATPLEIMREV